MDRSRYSLHFERRDASRNMARYYALALEPSLLGRITLVRRWGRIGTHGHCRSECFESECAAIAAMLALARAKRRRGYRVRSATVAAVDSCQLGEDERARPTELTAVNF